MAKRAKKRKGKIFIFLSILIFSAIGITIAYAANNAINTATNVVTIGNVKIALHNQDDEEVNLYSKDPNFNHRNIMPGEQIEKFVSVENVGDYPAYIRMKVKREWLHNDNKPQFKAEAIEPSVEDGWSIGTAEDSDYVYYYYQTIVTPSAIIPFMKSFCVSPGAIVQDNIDKNPNAEGKITVVAEAVQSDCYTPTTNGNTIINWEQGAEFGKDFENDIPNPSVVTQSAVTQSAVEFVGNSGDFVSFKDGTDLFLNVKGLMPGRTVEQIISIKNIYDNPVKVYLYAKIPDDNGNMAVARSNTEWELLKELILTIHSIDSSGEKREIYKGALFENDSSKDMLSKEKAVCLGTFLKGKSYQLVASVTLPGSWSHSYCQTRIDWVFVTEEMLKPSTPTPPPASPSKPLPVPTSSAPTIVPEEPTQEPPTTLPEETLEPTSKPQVEVTDKPLDIGEPEDTPEPSMTPRPTNSPPPITPTPTDFELGGDDNPMAKPSIEPRPSKTPKPVTTKTPKKTKKPETPNETKNPEESVGGDVPKIDVTPDLPEESATKTGDDTPIFFWGVVCFVSLLGILYNGIILGKRK